MCIRDRDYVENFLGADILFFSSEMPQGRVIATPVNNIIPYYVDPGDSEFTQAGLSYTTDAQVPYICLLYTSRCV